MCVAAVVRDRTFTGRSFSTQHGSRDQGTNPLKIPRSGPRCGWLPMFNQLFRVQRYTSGKIFMKIRTVDFTRIVNRHAERPSVTERPTSQLRFRIIVTPLYYTGAIYSGLYTIHGVQKWKPKTVRKEMIRKRGK